MLCIAGQTAGPIGLKFFVDTLGWSGGVIGSKNRHLFLNICFSKTFSFFHGQHRAFWLVCNKALRSYIYIYILAEADQTAGLNSLNNLRKPTGTLGITKRKG